MQPCEEGVLARGIYKKWNYFKYLTRFTKYVFTIYRPLGTLPKAAFYLHNLKSFLVVQTYQLT